MCPLCLEKSSSNYATGENRVYLLCKTCNLVYVPSLYFISKKDEKAKYDNHQNSPQNQGYKDFLNRLINPLSKELSQSSYGLDFGCGPGPTLSLIMQEKGHKMELYDYFYYDNKTVFEKEYDFITSTEVIEHLHHPLKEIQRLWECLKPDGVLGIMTAFRPNIDEFSSWYYKRDLTHIRFFTKKTFQWLANRLNAKLQIPENGVILLKKGAT